MRCGGEKNESASQKKQGLNGGRCWKKVNGDFMARIDCPKGRSFGFGVFLSGQYEYKASCEGFID